MKKPCVYDTCIKLAARSVQEKVYALKEKNYVEKYQIDHEGAVPEFYQKKLDEEAFIFNYFMCIFLIIVGIVIWAYRGTLRDTFNKMFNRQQYQNVAEKGNEE